MTTSDVIAVSRGEGQQLSSATVVGLAESAIRDAYRNGVLSIILAIPFELAPEEARLLLRVAGDARTLPSSLTADV